MPSAAPAPVPTPPTVRAPTAGGQLGPLIERVVAEAFRIGADELRAPSRRSAPVAFARQSAMYLSHVVFGLSYSQIGRIFRRDRTTVAHACRLIEGRRDDPRFDRMLCAMEALCSRQAVVSASRSVPA